MHVDGAGATEVVVAPHLLQQLRTGEDPTRVLCQVLQQLELLERQVERRAADTRLVGRLVDAEVTGPDLLGPVGLPLRRHAAEREPDPGLDLGRTGTVEQHVVEAPVGRDRGQTTLGDDRQQRCGRASGAQHP